MEKIREMSEEDIEKFQLQSEKESPSIVIDGVPVEIEDIHIVYRVAKQTRFEAAAEQGVSIEFFLAF